jgi:hypothetical protein
VKLHDLPHERELYTESAWRAPVVSIHRGKEIENTGQHLPGDALTCVLDCHHYHAVTLLRGERDASSEIRIPGRVVEKVRENLDEALPIGVEMDVLRGKPHSEPVSGRFERRETNVERTAHKLRQLDALFRQSYVVLGDVRDIHELVDQPGHLPDLAIQQIDGSVRIRRRVRLKHVDSEPHRSERITQLVRQAGEEIAMNLVWIAPVCPNRDAARLV